MSRHNGSNAKMAQREAALGRRAALPAGARRNASRRAGACLAGLAPAQLADIGGYWPIRAEIDPRPALAALARRGHRICLPSIYRGELVFRQVGASLLNAATVNRARRNNNSEGANWGLVRSQFGTWEPAAHSRQIHPRILIVPLAAFDNSGNRIGYGGGYYDRYIAARRAAGALHAPLCIGLACACQYVAAIAAERHDQRLDLIVTERGCAPCR